MPNLININSLKRRFRKAVMGNLIRKDKTVDPIRASFATRKNRIYRAGCSASDRRKVHIVLREETCALIRKKYQKPIQDSSHTANIQTLADKVSKECGQFLRGGRLRIGVAQKYLNLKLKGLWVLDRVPTPPHCPFDGVVLNDILKLGLHGKKTWTASDSIPEYRQWVKAAEKEAGKGRNLAEWELAAYDGYLQARKRRKR